MFDAHRARRLHDVAVGGCWRSSRNSHTPAFHGQDEPPRLALLQYDVTPAEVHLGKAVFELACDRSRTSQPFEHRLEWVAATRFPPVNVYAPLHRRPSRADRIGENEWNAICLPWPSPCAAP
jgi:hypothetical protein